jgi:hypothetical protein
VNTAVNSCIRVRCSVRGGIAVPWRSSAGLLQSCLRFWQNLTQRNRGWCQEVLALVGKLNAADPDSQRKEGQQDRKGNLERSPIGEHAGHMEVQSHEHQWL